MPITNKMFYFLPNTLTLTSGSLLFTLFFGSSIILLSLLNAFSKVTQSFFTVQRVTLCVTYCVFILSVFFAVVYNNSEPGYQFLFEWPASYFIGIDSLSLYFIVLTAAIFPICILITRPDIPNAAGFFLLLLLLEFFLILAFLTTDLLFFYVAFESTLMPMLLIINNWGSRQRKMGAANYLFLYTLAGSFFMLFAILLIYFAVGTTDFLWIKLNRNALLIQEDILWICFFIGFAVKVPIMPFHLWLPEAHVEAPTIGSIILASLLLKLGGYGLIRISLSLFPNASLYFTPIIYILCLVSIIYSSLLALRQIDIKKIIAYSSIAHMNIAILGIFSGSDVGLQGAIFLMIGHGIVAGALFFCVGVLYERYHTRLLEYYGGLTQVMPLFSFFFTFFNVVSVGFPGTCNFVGEFAVLAGLFKSNIYICILAAASTILGTGYALLLNTRICFGQLKIKYINQFSDLTKKEVIILVFFGFWALLIGVYPTLITDTTTLFSLALELELDDIEFALSLGLLMLTFRRLVRQTPPQEFYPILAYLLYLFFSVYGYYIWRLGQRWRNQTILWNHEEIFSIMSQFHEEIILTVIITAALVFNICVSKPTQPIFARKNHRATQLFFFSALSAFFFIFLPIWIPFSIDATTFLVSFFSVTEILVVLSLILTFIIAVQTIPQQHSNISDYPLLIWFLGLFSFFMIKANSLLMIFVLIESINIILYVLMLLDKPRAVSRGEAVLKYYTNSVCAAGLFLFSFLVITLFSQSLDLATIHTTLEAIFYKNTTDGCVVAFLFGTAFLFGLFFKLAAYPCALWAPDVYNTLTSGLLFIFSVFTKLLFFVTIFAFCKLLFFVFGVFEILIIVGVGSLIAGALGAITQSSILRFYAFSSMHHVGLILITTATGSRAAVAAAVLYTFGYLFTTTIFFLILTGVKSNIGHWRRRVTGWRISSLNWVSSISITICLLSMLGLPPFIGFFLKYYLFVITLYSGNFFLFICAAVTGVIAAYNYLWVIRSIFFPSIFLSNSTNYAVAYQFSWFWVTDFFNKNKITLKLVGNNEPLLLKWSYIPLYTAAIFGTCLILSAIIILKYSNKI